MLSPPPSYFHFPSTLTLQLDPNRGGRSENAKTLLHHVTALTNKIFESALACPLALRRLFLALRECAMKRFPDNSVVPSTAIRCACPSSTLPLPLDNLPSPLLPSRLLPSCLTALIASGFIFLRFFCPAIMNPKLFNMMPGAPLLLALFQ
jgi:hypothetical protein